MHGGGSPLAFQRSIRAAGRQKILQTPGDPLMVEGAERVQLPTRGTRNYRITTLAAASCGDLYQPAEQIHRNERGIAGQNQTPRILRLLKDSEQSPQRAETWNGISQARNLIHRNGKVSNQEDLPTHGLQDNAEMLGQRGMFGQCGMLPQRRVFGSKSLPAWVPWQQSLRTPHATACSTGHEEAQNHSNRMVALGLRGICLGLRRIADRVEGNNLLRICLILGGLLLFLTAGAVKAAVPERPAPSRKVTTVGVDPETGRLVRVRPSAITESGTVKKSMRTPAAIRKSVAKAQETARQTPDVDSKEIQGMIDDTAKRHGVDPALVHSVVRVESNYQQKAISPKGAQGLMQLIPATAHRYGVANPFDPSQNLEGGVRYLKYLTERFDGDLRLALAAYNAGEGAVDRHRGIPPFQETRQYVTKVTRELQTRGVAMPVLAELQPVKDEGDALSAQQQELRPRQAPLRVYTDAEGRLYIETVSVP